MAKTLHYFDVNGVGEPIRYILHYTKQEFQDNKYNTLTWPMRDTLPYGSLPRYQEDNRSLKHPLAITKYVARDTGLIPEDPWQQAVLDGIVYNLFDFWFLVVDYLKADTLDKRYELKTEIIENTIGVFFLDMERQLKRNGGYFSGKLSWAEFVLCGIVEASDLFLDIDLAKDYPTVKAAMEKIRNLPGVKEYIAARKPYKVHYFKTTQYKGLSILHL